MTTAREKRIQTARALGNQFERSPRTIRRIIAEPRDEYLSNAQKRREKIRELRKAGLSYRAIAHEVGCAVGTVHNALADIEGAR